MASNPSVSGPFGPLEKKALTRLGDVMVPGGEGFPSFSELGCIDHVNDFACVAPLEDIRALSRVLKALAIAPGFCLRALCWAMLNADRFPFFLATPLRQLNIGLRGLIVTPYFASLTSSDFTGATPHEVMDFSLNRLRD